ncbi:hypothetical protein MMC19_001295 [Ptychographa xylographoides]|nr:hypothetical protein [Ptychographa xylographoides]
MSPSWKNPFDHAYTYTFEDFLAHQEKRHFYSARGKHKVPLPTPEQRAVQQNQFKMQQAKESELIASEAKKGRRVGYYTYSKYGFYHALCYCPDTSAKLASSATGDRHPDIKLTTELPGPNLGGVERQESSRKRPASSMEGLNADPGVVSLPEVADVVRLARRPVGRPRQYPLHPPAVARPFSSLGTAVSEAGELILGEGHHNGLFKHRRRTSNSRCLDLAATTVCNEKAPNPKTCEEQMLIHTDFMQPCENTEAHLTEEGGARQVCSECIDNAHNMLLTRRPDLMKSSLLPLCKDCTRFIKAKYPYPCGHDGCTCPLMNPINPPNYKSGRWLCLNCRTTELELAQRRRATEEEWRRGLIGAGFVDGKIETVFIGRKCPCGGNVAGRELDEGAEGCAMRCAGCYGHWHSGNTVATLTGK